jgi:LmeA-like phospholipid-binding
MRAFLAGFLTALVTLALAAVLVVVSLPVADRPPEEAPAPRPPGAPRTVAKGETWLADAVLSSGSLLTSDGPLSDVRVNGSGVHLTAGGLRADRLAIEATLPFGTAARQVGNDVELYAAPAGRAGVRRTTTVLGRTVGVEATGTVRAENGQLVLEPVTVDLGGPDVLDSALSAAARRLVTIRHTVTGLPAGMRLTQVTVADRGFHVVLTGSDVVLTQ